MQLVGSSPTGFKDCFPGYHLKGCEDNVKYRYF